MRLWMVNGQSRIIYIFEFPIDYSLFTITIAT